MRISFARRSFSRLTQTLLGVGIASLGLAAYAQPPARVMVEWQDGSAQVSGFAAGRSASEQSAAGSAEARSAELSQLARDLGARIRVSSGPSAQWSVVQADGVSEEQLITSLSNRPGVASVVPDRRKTIRRMPNDPRYAEQWAWAQQQAASIRAEQAWDITTGSAAVVVAVVDTGVRFEHEDLRDRLLPGYDFIADIETAGDGDGRDADPSDPGDFLTSAELHGEFFEGCGDGDAGDQPVSSSWHGTMVSGIVAAAGNNSRGIAGVGWETRVLPLRVLGKCGGYDSDIVAAMRWAAGLQVPGVPNNPYPARIVNLSLGGEYSCSRIYRQTLEELRQRGVLVVAAAGNSGGGVEEPGNCPGVVTVGGLRHDGIKVRYSSFGPEVSLSAPSGNCGEGWSCQYQITTTTNLGRTYPTQNGYTDGNNAATGTSFSTPQASGVLALMLAIHPGLSADTLESRLLGSTRAFPVVAGLPQCSSQDRSTGECNCVTGQCGAGMLDAAAAVSSALRPQAQIQVSGGGTEWTLDARNSTAAQGRRIVSWEWQASGGASVTTATAATTRVVAAVTGEYPVRLTVRDNTGAVDTIEQRLQITGNGAQPAPVQPGLPSVVNSLDALYALVSQLLLNWGR